MNELKEQRKGLLLCVQCGAPLDRKGICCKRCNDMNNISKSKRTLQLHIEGKCTNCGVQLDRNGWFCSKCVKDMKLKARERNMERRSKGLCVQCGVKTNLGSYCQRCLDMRMDRYWRKKGQEI